MDDEITEFCIISQYVTRELKSKIQSLSSTCSYFAAIDNIYNRKHCKALLESNQEGCRQIQKLLDNIDNRIEQYKETLKDA